MSVLKVARENKMAANLKYYVREHQSFHQIFEIVFTNSIQSLYHLKREESLLEDFQ